jgi:hypothetical protein
MRVRRGRWVVMWRRLMMPICVLSVVGVRRRMMVVMVRPMGMVALRRAERRSEVLPGI